MIIPPSTILFTGILIATSLLFAFLTTAMGRLASAHEQFRLRAPARYAIGSALVLSLFALTDVVLRELGGHATPGHLLALYLASGTPVLVGWHFDPQAPVEEWPGMGPKRLTNTAMALVEDSKAWLAAAKEAEAEIANAQTKLDESLTCLHSLRTEDVRQECVPQARRRMAKKAHEEEK